MLLSVFVFRTNARAVCHLTFNPQSIPFPLFAEIDFSSPISGHVFKWAPAADLAWFSTAATCALQSFVDTTGYDGIEDIRSIFPTDNYGKIDRCQITVQPEKAVGAFLMQPS